VGYLRFPIKSEARERKRSIKIICEILRNVSVGNPVKVIMAGPMTVVPGQIIYRNDSLMSKTEEYVPK
jgi:hypothetical protein